MIHIRVRGRPEGFDETNAVRITGGTQVEMGNTFGGDYLAAMRTVELSRNVTTQDGGKGDVQQRDPTSEARYASQDLLPSEASADHRQETNADAVSTSLESSKSSKSVQDPISSVDDIMRMDIFTGADEDLGLVPLVDLWPELANNLKEEDIPSALELYREIDMIQG